MYEKEIKEVEFRFKQQDENHQKIIKALTISKEELLRIQGEHRLLLKLQDEHNKQKEKEQNLKEEKGDKKGSKSKGLKSNTDA